MGVTQMDAPYDGTSFKKWMMTGGTPISGNLHLQSPAQPLPGASMVAHNLRARISNAMPRHTVSTSTNGDSHWIMATIRDKIFMIACDFMGGSTWVCNAKRFFHIFFTKWSMICVRVEYAVNMERPATSSRSDWNNKKYSPWIISRKLRRYP